MYTGSPGTVYLEFQDDVVLKKTVSPQTAVAEAEMQRRCYEVAQASGSFRVPRLKDVNREECLITMERLRGHESLWDTIAEDPARLDLIQSAGHVLGLIHRCCGSCTDEVRPDPRPIPQRWGRVMLHGDYSARNILVGQDGVLAVIDFDGKPGPASFDVSFFLSSIGRIPPHMRSLCAFRARARAFLAGYVGSEGDVPWQDVRNRLLYFGNCRLREVARRVCKEPRLRNFRRLVEWLAYVGALWCLFHRAGGGMGNGSRRK